MKRILLFIVIDIVGFATNGFGQFFDRLANPTITINLKHAPALGIKVNKIAFGVADGSCSDQITDAIKSDFVSNNVEVLDRENLSTILAEQNLSLSGTVDAATAAKVGKILGPSAYLIVKVQRCSTTVQTNLYRNETKYDYNTKQNYTVRVNVSRTTAELKASIQTIDLTTGRTFAAAQFSYTPVKENTSSDGIPVAPLESEVQDVAFRNIVWDVHKLFLEWSEQRKVVFFDDKKGGLKEAYQALERGDIDGAFSISKKNVRYINKNIDQSKDKAIGHAYYNLAMMYMLKEQYESAIEWFNAADEYRGGEIVQQALNECKTALALARNLKKVEEKAAIVEEKRKNDTEVAKKEVESNTLTNEDVIKMTQQKLSEFIIIQKIKKSNCKFNTTTDGLSALSQAGVNDNIISAMIDK